MKKIWFIIVEFRPLFCCTVTIKTRSFFATSFSIVELINLCMRMWRWYSGHIQSSIIIEWTIRKFCTSHNLLHLQHINTSIYENTYIVVPWRRRRSRARKRDDMVRKRAQHKNNLLSFRSWVVAVVVAIFTAYSHTQCVLWWGAEYVANVFCRMVLSNTPECVLKCFLSAYLVVGRNGGDARCDDDYIQSYSSYA